LRIPPSAVQVGVLFDGWRAELATCRKFAPAARSYAAARLMADVGLRVNEASHLDLADVKWDLGRFGKLHVRIGKGARGSGPRERMVPLINGAGATLRWFIQDVWSCFDDDHARPGAPLFCSERRNADGTAARAGNETLRSALAAAAAAHLPGWPERVTPHVLRHFCASQLYLGGMDLVAIQETLGHAWVATTMNYIHVHATHVEDAWIARQQRYLEGQRAAADARRGGPEDQRREDVRTVVGPPGQHQAVRPRRHLRRGGLRGRGTADPRARQDRPECRRTARC